MSINIHGKTYITVAERVTEAHKDLKVISITTEVLDKSPVVIKATVTTPKGTFTGISAANPAKMIEKMSPYEVAETSAIGRALGFAGYGVVEGIATADEVKKAEVDNDPEWIKEASKNLEPAMVCEKCGSPVKIKTGVKKDGNPWKGAFCQNPKCKLIHWISDK